jgi:glycosyltransferase involved in cell wall biosynthesis
MTVISVMIPTRGRPTSLEKTLRSLIDQANNVSRLEILLAVDDDDSTTIEFLTKVVRPWFDQDNVKYTFVKFKRLGYSHLHQYINQLSNRAVGNWLFFINDDAVVKTPDWDQIILDHGKEFALLRAETTNQHPYAIFPILPKKWVEITGNFSQHQLNDAWVSQIGWMLDIVKTIPVMIEHNRFDLTGEHQDDTFKERVIFEGNPKDPRDFNNDEVRKNRIDDTFKLANYLEQELGYELRWFKDAVAGKVNVWDKMLALDKKGLMRQWKN